MFFCRHRWHTLQSGGMGMEVTEILAEKERVITHLNDKMEILELKVQKLEQLLRLKDGKIEALQQRLQQNYSR